MAVVGRCTARWYTGDGFRRTSTGVRHTAKRRDYWIGLASGIDPAAATVSLSGPGAATGVFTTPGSTNCASGEVEVDTSSSSRRQATQALPSLGCLEDGGFTLIIA